jgi:hypothetical protein
VKRSPRRTLNRNQGSLSRASGFLSPRKTLIVLCEGAVSEADYLEALRREPAVREAASVDIRVDSNSFGCAPLTLVRRAVEIRKKSAAENDEVDEVWCVFDVEWTNGNQHHPNLHDALYMARSNDIYVAVSNPCFEYWLILHFRDHNSFLDNSAARHLRAELDGSMDKAVDGAQYMHLRDEAQRRAERMDRRHVENGTPFPHNNPSSGMHLLLNSVKPPTT